jgi:hypothetical protein
MILRRELIALLGGAVIAWPDTLRGQQKPMPVIGYLSQRSPTDSEEEGYVDGQNVVIESRFA